ncbi:MAG: T9SS type A sorting domain-containing protein [Bacteroidales bacterium]|nr:T9SS type A sorting domain-containing protein [Bacteroidales bacterium]
MDISSKYRLALLGSILITAIISMDAQLQFPGKPMGDYRQLKAADVMYVLPPVDPLEIEAGMLSNESSQKKPFQFAIERPVDISPDLHGSWVKQDGNRIWRVHILSPDAYSMGLVFNEYALEEGVKVLIYDPGQDHIKGAFTSGNNKASRILAVGHLSGDELIVELQVPADVPDYGRLSIESISHAFLPLVLNDQKKDGRFGRSQECEIDINCEEGADWQLSKRSVVRIFTTTQYCTGVLVNNTSYDGKPYVITAEHCINTENNAQRSVFVFNYESPECFGNDGSVAMSISGSELLAVGDSVDFCLVKLSVTPPDSFDVYYTGWDLNNNQDFATTTIHHPEGDVKKISYDSEAPSTPANIDDLPNSDIRDYHYFSYWWIKQWDIGSTEGGSSGSPLFNSDRRMIGSLSGGRAKCGDSIGYDAENDRIIYRKIFNIDDYYTKLNVAWDYYPEDDRSLKPWLDPMNTGDEKIDGYHPTHTDPPGVLGNSSFILYPNPVNEVLYISSGPGSGEKISYQVFDLSGVRRLSGYGDEAGPVKISTGSLEPGIYLIGVEAGGSREFLKFIITR